MPSMSKKSMFEEIAGQFEANSYAFISSFEKINVAGLSDARQKLEKVSKRSMVVKHAMVKKIFEKRNLNAAEKLLKGSVIITFGDKEPQIISKTIVDFCKTNEKFASNGVIFENQVYDQAFVKRLAMLPSRQELLTQVVVRMKSPISGVVLTLGQVVRGVVVALNEIKKLKESQAQPA